MAQSTINGFFTPAYDAVLDDDEPVSSYRAWELRQNILHCTDEFTQHRINWVADATTGGFVNTPDPAAGTVPNRLFIWAQPYVHTWLSPFKPANIDLCVTASSVESGIVVARLVPMSTAPGDEGPFILLGSFTASDPSSQNTITHVMTVADFAVLELGWQRPAIVAGAGGESLQPRMCLMRLELLSARGANDDAVHVHGVLMREYA